MSTQPLSTPRSPGIRLGDAGSASVFPTLPVRLAPDRALLTYYALSSLLLGPAFLFMLVPMFFRFRTIRYEIDDEGIGMRWGILFRREISLTYTRIQDIHLSSNFVERWLGLARIQVQTASGSASAEMTIEGLPYPEAIRDFLYERMRGAREQRGDRRPRAPEVAGGSPADEDLASVLRNIADEVRAIRETLPARVEGGER